MSIKEKINRIKYLTNQLNIYRDSYYNKSVSIISDYEYDCLFDELKNLETETNFMLSNSPTQTVGFPVNSKFDKVIYDTPLLSLDKTQIIDEFIKFCIKSDVILMHKLDGLTIKLTYSDGKLIQASTRGNGVEGDDITENAKYFSNIPLSIPITHKVSVIGEAIITRDDFENINSALSNDKKFKNPRNLASGSVKQLDTKIVKDRHIKFICWNANDLSTDGTMNCGLSLAELYGFEVVSKLLPTGNLAISVPQCIDELKQIATDKLIPIDGIVAMYDNIEFGNSLGKTSHHYNNGYAYKFYDEEELTTLRNIEWSMGKTGELTPVAIFDTVEIDGTSVNRASLHNVNTIEELEIGIGDTIAVYKANLIIPQIRKSITKSRNITIPTVCPICNCPTKIISNYNNNKEVKTLVCTNDNCKGKLLGKLNHFVSKEAMNIDGLSESTLEKLISLNIINNIIDVYNIPNNKSLLYNIEGFGDISINKLINSIESSKTTTTDRFLNALSIPTVGKSVSKLLSDFIENDSERIFELSERDLTVINGIGSEMNKAIHDWFTDTSNKETVKHLLNILSFKRPNNKLAILHGKSFVITGKLNHYKNRGALEDDILHNGGTLQYSVTSNTTYLINNDINSSSSKNRTAKELNVTIITEKDFIEMIKGKTVNNNVNSNSKDNNVTKKSKRTLF